MIQLVGGGLLRVGLLLLPRRQFRGFDVHSQTGRKNLESFIGVLGNALDLIHEQQPRQHAMVRRHIQRFVLAPSGGDHFVETIRAHVVSWDWPSSREPIGLALNIVHEATHARLAAWGCRPTPESIGRIEALCVAQEIALAERLPNGPSLVDGLQNALKSPWWGMDQARSRAEARLRSAGTPETLIHLVLRVRFGRQRNGR